MTNPEQIEKRTNTHLKLRPTLVVGLGGTGHRIVVNIKALALQTWGAEQTSRMLKFLVFDTAQETLTAGGITLEPGSEFIDIGQTPVANIKRNLERQTAIKDRLGNVMANLPPAVLRSGAKQLRPLGLLAFLWRYNDVEERLRGAIWGLAGRQQTENKEGINVFIANSLVGGTGSSTFLDVAHLIRDLFDELGTLADFCYLTGIGVLPRAFHGINGPNLIPNTVASLKELNHCMMRGGFEAHYPNGRTITTKHPPFNIYYLIDGVDERGHTWYGAHEVCRMAAEAAFLQMGSQVGQKQENDFDNLDDVLVQETDEGIGTFYGSFGLASLVFSGGAVAQACAARLAMQLVDQKLLVDDADPLAEPATQAETFREGDWLNLGRLTEQLTSDEQNIPMTVELSIPGWAERLPLQERAGQLVRYARDYERTRLGVDFKRRLAENERHLIEEHCRDLNQHVHQLAYRQGLVVAEKFLLDVLQSLETQAGVLSGRQAEHEYKLSGLTNELSPQENTFLQAGEGLFLGRGRRVTQAQQAYFGFLERFYQIRWQVQVTSGTLGVVTGLTQMVRQTLADCREAISRLQVARRSLESVARIFAGDDALNGVTSSNLADEKLVATLYEQNVPPLTDAMTALFSGQASPLDWQTVAPEAIQQQLLSACEPAFEPVTRMTVEDALELNEQKISPEGYYNRLMAQATPSWNLDRTRLADGGSGLQRLEVLGVPAEAATRFQQYARMLVSTGDPSRLMAFVAHVGAAHVAIQQWDGYLASYERVRGYVPLHILPQFQADSEGARQAFALGSLFGFIKNQGSYFYYVPADNLSKPVKLAQGLSNTLQAFINRDALVREAWERIEQVVAAQGVETVLRRLTAYYDDQDTRYPADDLILELKQLVRRYADELRQVYQFTGSVLMSETEPTVYSTREVRHAA